LAAYGTWRAGGPAGPILLAAALFTAAFATLYALARRRLPAWGAAALVVLAAQAAVERFTVRPEAATFLLLATYLLVPDRPPFGLAGALFPLRLLGVLRGAEVTSAPIIEHRAPALAELSPPVALGLVALLALAALAALVSWRRWRIAHLLIAAAFTALALLARRNVALIGPGVLPLVASGLAPVAAAADRRRARPPRAAAARGAAPPPGPRLAP